MISKWKKIIMGISLLFQRIKIDRPGKLRSKLLTVAWICADLVKAIPFLFPLRLWNTKQYVLHLLNTNTASTSLILCSPLIFLWVYPFFIPFNLHNAKYRNWKHISFHILSLYKCQWQSHSPSLITKTHTLIFLLQSFSTLLLIKFILST